MARSYCERPGYLRGMKHLEHVGIAVSDLAGAERIFTDLLGTGPYKREDVLDEGVRTSFFQAGGTKVELLGALTPDGPIARHLEKRGPGLHHLAFAVDDMEGELARLEGLGYVRISGPKPGADGKVIAFLHPGGTGKVLVAWCAAGTPG